MTQVLLCGAAILTLSMGIRHGFGLWLQPITQSQDWSRETFAFARCWQCLHFTVSLTSNSPSPIRFGYVSESIFVKRD